MTPKPTYTLEDVAARAGVSRAQASRALRGDPGVRDETRRHVLAVAEAMDYRPNAAARALASNNQLTIGILIGNILNPFEALIAAASDRALQATRYDAVLAINAQTDAEAEKAASRLIDKRIAGLILIGSPREQGLIRRIAARVPTVYIGRDLASIGVASVSTDDLMGARLATEHLIGLGHRRIAHISGGGGAGAARREKSYRAVMAEAGLAPLVHQGHYDIDAGLDAVHQLMALPARPSAIFAGNDLVAIGAMNRLFSLGYSVPRDVSVVGFDDIPLASSSTIALSTVRQPKDEMVARGIDMLIRRIEAATDGVENLILAPDFVPRNSTTAPAG